MSERKEGRRGGKTKKKREGVGQGRDTCSEEREGEREGSVRMTGIHASKEEEKKWFVWRERRTSAISLWAVRYAVGLLFCTCFLFGSLFAILPAKKPNIHLFFKIGHFTPPVHILLILKSVREDQSVLQL